MNDAEFSALVERSYQVQGLQQTDGWLYLLDETQRVMEAKRREVLSGRLAHDDYLKACGWLEGADYVLNAPARLEEKKNREADLRGKKTAA